MRITDRGSRRGQTLLISVIVLFLLLFLGAIFMVMISHNISRSGRSKDVLQATKLAEAGLRYANQMLLYSEDGADWRPPLTDKDSVLANDPDKDWILDNNDADGVHPFTRYVTEDGRFLLRVTYEPMNMVVEGTAPSGITTAEWKQITRDINGLRMFIKIEAIGRPGYISPDDPTTFPAKPDRLRRELIAYKPIGLLENLWFVTNKKGLNEPLRMGVPTQDCRGPLVALASKTSYFNGSIRVNGDLEWMGSVRIRLNSLGLAEDNDPNKLQADDCVAVAGLIRHAPGADVQLTIGTLTDDPLESDDSGFKSYDGRYLDAAAPLSGRKVTRLEPPLVDQVDAGGNGMRYRSMTHGSGSPATWPNAVPQWGIEAQESYNTGWNGLGRGIYIDNNRDRQPKDLPSEWASPGVGSSWTGGQYIPPGVEIVVYPYDLGRSALPIRSRSWGYHPENTADPYKNDDGIPDVWIRRTDGGRFLLPTPGSGQPIDTAEIVLDYPENGVIFAEGNVCIRGTVGSPSSEADWWEDDARKGHALTVVSNRTIYVEGNILKERYEDDSDWVRYDDTGIALLARDNVCVNTTRFTRIETGFQLAAESIYGRPEPYDVQMSDFLPGGQGFFRVSFALGSYVPDVVDPQYPLYLLAEHASGAEDQGNSMPFCAYSLSYIESAPAFYSFRLIDINVPPYFSGLTGWYGFNVLSYPATQTSPNFEKAAYRLWSEGNNVYSFGSVLGMGIPGVECNMYVTPPLIPSGGGGSGMMVSGNDYLVRRYVVAPMDVWIEAAVYAQEGCFFIIPGYWLNTNENDVPDPSFPNKTRKTAYVKGTNPVFPFHYEPIDARITIYGSIAENKPADVGHAMDWIEKWGWTPETLGSTGSLGTSLQYAKWVNPDVDRPGVDTGGSEFNVRYIYDPAFRYYCVDSAGNHRAFPSGNDIDPWPGSEPKPKYRMTNDGQILPLLPRLPVSPTMIYTGESMQIMQGP